MRTSLNNIKAIDDYLLGYMSPEDALLFEACMILNGDLVNDIAYQRLTHDTIIQYGRKNIRAEIAAVQKKLAAEPEHRGYIQRIADLFK
jgi:fructose-1,6-bisphosphatase/sedoheptulose 1,7-bisphosphatase-like protein